jgi:hypothetical protein
VLAGRGGVRPLRAGAVAADLVALVAGCVTLAGLQSWSQGVEVWGRDGMRKLWSAANIKFYGGGVSEVEFLSELSQLVGDFDLHA